MAAKYVKHIVLPDTTLIAVAMLSLVRRLPGKLVCLDFRQKWLATIMIDDEVKLEKTQKILQDIIQHPQHAVQPDWSFLTADVEQGVAANTSAENNQ